MADQGREQTRCTRRDPRGHQCELPAGHAGDHQRQPALLTWPEWLGGDATEGKGEMLECLECGDERTEDRLNPIDWGVGLGLCCCSAKVHVTRHELDAVQAEQQVIDTFLASENQRLRRERDELREQNSKLHRDLAGARQLARWLWRPDGVRQQWAPPAKYELDWLTREAPTLDEANERRRQTIARYWDDEDDDPPATARSES